MLVVGGAALVSCTKNQDDLLPTTETATTTNALQKVKVENGYLVFEDLAHYDAVAEQVIAMTETQRQLWEKQLSFKSYYTLYNEATAAYSDAATEEETQAVLTQNQDIMTLDADQTPERTLRYGSLGLLFNRSGIVKIGNYLKQCTPNDKQVVVFDGDLNTLAAARATTVNYPSVWFYTANINCSLTNNAIFSCQSESWFVHQINETLNCPVTL